MYLTLRPGPLDLPSLCACGALLTSAASCGDDLGTAESVGATSTTGLSETTMTTGPASGSASESESASESASESGSESASDSGTTGASATSTGSGETTMSTGDTTSASGTSTGGGESESEGTDTATLCEPGATESCYSGPEETLNVGLCVAGTRTCNREGTGFGPCADEVTPTAEVCSTEADEDCSGDVPECGAALWKKRFGGKGADEGSDLAVGPDDGIVLSGVFDAGSSIDFGGATFDNKGSFDGFIASFDGDGTHRWSRAFGGAKTDMTGSVAIDSTGAVLFVGDTTGTVDLGGGPLTSTGSRDIIVAKYDSEGDHLWSAIYTGPMTQLALDCAFTSDDTVLLGGVFRGSVDFGGGVLTSEGLNDIYLTRLSGDGELLWSKRFGDALVDHAAATVLAPDDAIVQTGYFSGELDYGGAPLVTAGGLDVFVAKLDADGELLWSKRFGDGGSQRAEAAAVGEDGRILVGGAFTGTLDFGGELLKSTSAQDAFVAAFDADGAHLWSRLLQGPGTDQVTTVAIDGDGNTLVGGFFHESIDVGGATLTTDALWASWLAKYDPSGKLLFSTKYDSEVSSWIVRVAVDSLGDVFLAGHFTESVNIDGDTLLGEGYDDVVVAKIAL